MKRDVVQVDPDAGPRILRPVCTNCHLPVDRATLLYFGIEHDPVKLCDRCLGVLRRILTHRQRPRRPVSARGRRVLQFLAQTPAGHGSLATIGAATGGYAFNVLKSLLERRLIEQLGSESFRSATFRLSQAGVEMVDMVAPAGL